MSRSLFGRFACAMVAMLAAAPLLAYTIVLQDGSKIVAKDVHRIEGDRVVITLPNGTETFISLEEVDLEATEEFNANNIDGAMIIDGGETKGFPTAQPRPRATLRDLIASGQAKTRSRAPARRPESAAPAEPVRSAAGYLDFNTLQRSAYNDLEIMSDLRSYFTSQGLEAQVFSGSQSTHPMVEIITSSESAVFKSLEVAAQALPQLQDRHGSRITALELLLRTSRGSSAGQFVMTPQLAEGLNSGETEVAAFFVRNVRF